MGEMYESRMRAARAGVSSTCRAGACCTRSLSLQRRRLGMRQPFQLTAPNRHNTPDAC